VKEGILLSHQGFPATSQLDLQLGVILDTSVETFALDKSMPELTKDEELDRTQPSCIRRSDEA
jgi:hypothetical protein